MIKFKSSSLGAAHLNAQAKTKKDFYASALKGMKCQLCEEDTYVEFVSDGKRVNTLFDYCCDDFNDKINAQLNSFVR